MGLLSSENKNVKYLLWVTDILTKYAWVKPLKDKKSKTVLNAFIEIVNESNQKPNKLWVNQGREFYNKLMQEWLGNNNILMYCTHNEGKSVITKRFTKALKVKTYKKLIANECKSYLSLIKNLLMLIILLWMKNTETNPKVPKFKVNDRVRITKYKNTLVRVTLKTGQGKYLLSTLCWKLILGLIKLKI